MTKKLVIDENNVVVNIIVDADDELTTVHEGKLITNIDESVGIGDTVNEDGSLLSRRADFYIPTDEERAEEELYRQSLIRSGVLTALSERI